MLTWIVVVALMVMLGVVAVVKARAAGGDDGAIPGTASGWDVTAAMSRIAMWLTTAQTRPRTRVWPWSPHGELGLRIGRTSWWGLLKRGVYASFETIVLVLGPMGVGKSGFIAARMAKHPGPVLSTSSSVDIYLNTVAAREQVGPVAVMNPEDAGNGEVPSTVYWPLVDDCRDPAVAIRRAGDLISGTSTENLSESSWWESHAHRVLYAFLMAAALDGQGPEMVASWAANLADRRPLTILENHPNAPSGWADNVAWLVNAKADKMVETVSATLKPVFEFLADPGLRACVHPGPGRVRFDAEAMLRQNGTLYIVATNRGIGGLGPLSAALTGYVHETAKALGAVRRLDPPLMEALDEVALTCRVPLQRWAADMRKYGICALLGLQNRSQLDDVWGDEGAATIWANSVVKVVFGSIDDKETLETLSKLGGERIGQLNDRHERVPVLAPDRIKRMPDFCASVFFRNRRPVAPVRVDMVWEQRNPWWRRLRSWLRPERAEEAAVAEPVPEGVTLLDERRRRAA